MELFQLLEPNNGLLSLVLKSPRNGDLIQLVVMLLVMLRKEKTISLLQQSMVQVIWLLNGRDNKLIMLFSTGFKVKIFDQQNIENNHILSSSNL
jgi:hypothetical protein